MAYVAVKGGKAAIEASLKLLANRKWSYEEEITLKAIEKQMKLLVDQVMSESSLYAPELAARAIRQAEGSIEEAVFLVRAYRSTIERLVDSTIIDTEQMELERRISAAFKDIPKGQILGPTYDYSHRLFERKTSEERKEEALAFFMEQSSANLDEVHLESYEKVSNYLEKEGIMPKCLDDNTAPFDVTKAILEFPLPRSGRLQILTRGMGAAITSLGYAVIRGYGALHPTVGELRYGVLPIYIDFQSDVTTEDSYYIGKINVTETEMYIPHTVKDEMGEHLEIEIGYGFVYGQNETKAIGMGILDSSLSVTNKKHPTEDEEFVLYHVDSIEATGFLSHLKLPHYVTFQSKLDGIRKSAEKGDQP